MTLVSGGIRLMRLFAEVLEEGASNDSEVVQNGNFQHFTLEMRPALLYIAICSPSSAFQWSQNAWPWMTLPGYFALNCFRAGLGDFGESATSENNCVKTNKDRHILLAVQIFGGDSNFRQYKVYASTRRGSLERRHQTTVGSRIIHAHVLPSHGKVYSRCA